MGKSNFNWLIVYDTHETRTIAATELSEVFYELTPEEQEATIIIIKQGLA